jgi:hypothetical protein
MFPRHACCSSTVLTAVRSQQSVAFALARILVHTGALVAVPESTKFWTHQTYTPGDPEKNAELPVDC